jgi:hypothetical protein
MTSFLFHSRLGVLALLLMVATSGPLAISTAAQNVDALATRAARAGVDIELLQTVRARAAEQGLSTAEVARLIGPAVDLAENGLPSQPVLQKVLEGLSKRVPPAQLGTVVDRLAAATGRAGAVGDSWLARTDVPRGLREPAARFALVEGLTHGLAQENAGPVLEALLERLPRDLRRSSAGPADVAAAFRIAPSLPTAAAEPAQTARLLGQALAAGFSGPDLLQLPAALQSLQAREGLAATAALTRALDHMDGRGIPAAVVLEQLSRGGGPPAGRPTPPRGRP